MATTVTPTFIKTEHREFEHLTDAQIQTKIDESATKNNAATLGSRYNHAVEWFACHLIWNSPMGASMGLQADSAGETDPYLEEWKRIARPRARGPWLSS